MDEEPPVENVITVDTDTDTFTLHGRPCELSSFSFIPPDRQVPKQRTYFNSDKKEYYSAYGYDRIFHQESDFNPKLHRDDREHAKSQGLRVIDEESKKIVPTLSSSLYGKRLENQIDRSDRSHCRVGVVQADFYRRNGTEIDGHKL